MMAEQRTDFGFEQVPMTEKGRRVGAVFSSVAGRYDLMNDLMSLGLHRVWKRFAVSVSGVRPAARVLDLAGGTGDLTRLLLSRLGPGGQVVVADINEAMLERGRQRLVDGGYGGRHAWARVDAESLPFAERSFDLVCIAFGLRNVTRKERALAEMYRVLRVGGRALVLEFSHLRAQSIKPLYDAYSLHLLPALGRVVAGDEGSYRYLAESIRMHPDQSTLQQMMAAAGLERCDHFNLSAGIVALHSGYRL